MKMVNILTCKQLLMGLTTLYFASGFQSIRQSLLISSPFGKLLHSWCKIKEGQDHLVSCLPSLLSCHYVHQSVKTGITKDHSFQDQPCYLSTALFPVPLESSVPFKVLWKVLYQNIFYYILYCLHLPLNINKIHNELRIVSPLDNRQSI